MNTCNRLVETFLIDKPVERTSSGNLVSTRLARFCTLTAGFLSRWDRPASEREAEYAAAQPEVVVVPRRRRIPTLALAWMQLDGLRLLIGSVIGLVVFGLLALASTRADEGGPGLVALGALLLVYFMLSGGYGANPWWWPQRRREWWE